MALTQSMPNPGAPPIDFAYTRYRAELPRLVKKVLAYDPSGALALMRHTLRHTAATWLAQSGEYPFSVSGYLGMSQKTLETTYATTILTSRPASARHSRQSEPAIVGISWAQGEYPRRAVRRTIKITQ